MIRPATRGDLARIGAVIEAAFAEHRRHFPAEIFAGYLADMRALGGRWDECEVFVAEDGDGVVGSVAFYSDASREGLGLPKEWAGLRTLAVHPRARGRGLGRRLTLRCVERALALGVPAFGIHTAGFMTAACRVYESLGFRRAPAFDLRASAILGLDAAGGDIEVIAYVRDLSNEVPEPRSGQR